FSLTRFRDNIGVHNPCSWFGFDCSKGHVLSLNIDRTGLKSHRKLLDENQQSTLLPPPSAVAPPPSAIADPPPTQTLSRSDGQRSRKKNHLSLILSIAFGGTALVGIAVLFLCRGNKVATVRPWATGLSGQLQKAFVTGVPKLKRSELEAACEDFSNVIGSTSFGTVYKGTLSSGVEIAVASVATPSAKEWSKHLESSFRKRIDMLSKVNHKNFVNLLGFCEEDAPNTL
nr:probable inactive receptor-like protein kinase At3g56050 isoform X2 [Tanacetum cinerariifolium]